MKKIIEEIKFGDITKEQTAFGIIIYSNYIEASIALPFSKFIEISMQGGIQAERKSLNFMLKKIISENYNGLHIFNSEQDYLNKKHIFPNDTTNLSDGSWSKTAFIIPKYENNINSELENGLIFLINCYCNFSGSSKPIDKYSFAIHKESSRNGTVENKLNTVDLQNAAEQNDLNKFIHYLREIPTNYLSFLDRSLLIHKLKNKQGASLSILTDYVDCSDLGSTTINIDTDSCLKIKGRLYSKWDFC